MNFQDVKNAPEKQYVDNVNLTVLNIVNANPDQWKNHIQEVLAKDDTGAQERFRLQTKFADGLLDNNDLNRTMPFKLKWFNKQGGYGIQGYPLKPKKAGPPPPLGPPPQNPSVAPQSPNAPKPQQQVWDDKDKRITRLSCLNRAVDIFLQPNESVPWPVEDAQFAEIIWLAERFKEYTYNGLRDGDQFAAEQGLHSAAQDTNNY